MATDLLTISIRRKLDKGDKVGTNEVRMLLGMVDTLKNRVADLEKQLTTAKQQAQPAEGEQS
jgi:CO/xanthine dehydrogenase FAD-binding subunit